MKHDEQLENDIIELFGKDRYKHIHSENIYSEKRKEISMIYVTSKCPHCNAFLKKQNNPVHEIGVPFEKCPHCGGIYLNSYKQEWATKSTIKRFFFYLQSGVWARAFILSGILVAILLQLLGLIELFLPFYIVCVIAWLVIGYFWHKHLEKDYIYMSIKRTEIIEYVEMLKSANFKIYPIAREMIAVRHDNIDKEVNKKEEKQANNKGNKHYEFAEVLMEEGNVEQALQMYEIASKLGCDDADVSLGYIYLNGDHVDKDTEKAMLYFLRAKDKGNEYVGEIIKNIHK